MKPLKPFEQDERQYKAKEKETSYLVIERTSDGTEKELQTITHERPFSEQEQFQELTKAYRKAFPEAKFTYQPHPKLGLHLVDAKTKAIIYIKQVK